MPSRLPAAPAFARAVRILLLAAVSLHAPAPLWAAALCDPPQSRRVLRIQPAAPAPFQDCDLPALEQLPAQDIVTSLPPSLRMEGTHRWTGVRLRHLAERMGGGPQSTLRLTALNDYAIDIPFSDLVRYDPILAYRRDGQPMGIRHKGPLIVIYPFDAHPPLQAQEYINRTIWQVNAISIR